MFDQLIDLEGIVFKLEQVSSLFNCMYLCFFEEADPDPNDLVTFYEDYKNITEVMRDLVRAQTITLRESVDNLYEIRGELKEVAKKNKEVLDGGTNG